MLKVKPSLSCPKFPTTSTAMEWLGGREEGLELEPTPEERPQLEEWSGGPEQAAEERRGWSRERKSPEQAAEQRRGRSREQRSRGREAQAQPKAAGRPEEAAEEMPPEETATEGVSSNAAAETPPAETPPKEEGPVATEEKELPKPAEETPREEMAEEGQEPGPVAPEEEVLPNAAAETPPEEMAKEVQGEGPVATEEEVFPKPAEETPQADRRWPRRQQEPGPVATEEEVLPKAAEDMPAAPVPAETAPPKATDERLPWAAAQVAEDDPEMRDYPNQHAYDLACQVARDCGMPDHQQLHPEDLTKKNKQRWRWLGICQCCGYKQVSPWGYGEVPRLVGWSKTVKICPKCMGGAAPNVSNAFPNQQDPPPPLEPPPPAPAPPPGLPPQGSQPPPKAVEDSTSRGPKAELFDWDKVD